MAGSEHDSGSTIANINVTPLVDITLVLLVVFMVTAKLIVTPAVPLDLPRAEKSEMVQTVFSVILPLRGPMLVDGQAVPSDDAFLAKARSASAANPDLRAVINADGEVPHRRVVHAIDLLKQIGISRIALAALPPDKSTERGGPGIP